MQYGCNKLQSSINQILSLDEIRLQETEFMAPRSTDEITPLPRALWQGSPLCFITMQNGLTKPLALLLIHYFKSPVNAWAPGDWYHTKTEVFPTAECTISVLQMKHTGEFGGSQS